MVAAGSFEFSSGGLSCLHCGSTAVKRNGKYRSR